MNLAGHDIGVCSWSLKTQTTDELIATLDELQLDHLQLALGGLLVLDPAEQAKELEKLNQAEIAITAGMIGFVGENYATIASIRASGGFVPTEHWNVRKDLALAAGALCQQVGIDRVSTHLGFLPPGNDPTYVKLIERTRFIASQYADHGVDLLFETGQERATDLLMFLNDLNAKNVGINFDPANMILYGSGDPVEAVATLGRHIRHVHIKDAIQSATPGTEWGHEVPFGEGEVDHTAFLRALIDAGYDGPLVIEREAGETRLADIKSAILKLEQLLA